MNQHLSYRWRKSLPETQAFFTSHFSADNKKRNQVTARKYFLCDQSMHGWVNYWRKEELLLDKRIDAPDTNRFSLTEVVWIYILDELKKYGFTEEKLCRIKNFILYDDMFKCNDENPTLEGYIALVERKRTPVFIVVLSNGMAAVMTQNEKESLEEEGEFEEFTYVSIPLKRLITSVKRKIA